ncbi:MULTISPECIES: hypothetical protein [Lysinibacillus]|uniref:hypothetical protein n=1 Tax=Lysinibacillus TaxID=400634 RepID=UPI00257E1429|nr:MULTISPECIES: hypothetical protein [Lysinibacillus]
MDKHLMKELASEIVEQSRGRISMLEAEALAIVSISKMKNCKLTNYKEKVIQKIIHNYA